MIIEEKTTIKLFIAIIDLRWHAIINATRHIIYIDVDVIDSICKSTSMINSGVQ